MTLTDFLMAARYTVREPRAAARWVLGMGVPVPARWAALALMAVASTFLVMLDLRIVGATDDPVVQGAMANPMPLAAVQMLMLALSAWLMARVGRLFGGNGQFSDAVMLVVWMQAVLLVVQVVQILAALVSVPLSDGVALLGFAISMWLMTNFVAELHGFSSLGRVFLGILGAGLALAVVLATLLTVAMEVFG